MLKLWLGLFLGFFALGVDDPKDPPDQDPPPDDDPQSGLDLGGVDEDPDPQDDPNDDPQDDTATQLAAEKTARAAAEARAEQHQRELTELRAGQRPAAQTDDQKLFEREEARLADAKTTDLERWQIEANRKLRLNTQSSNAALFQAHDVADRTAFRQLEVTKPALFKRYEKRVEEELVKIRKAGGNTTRDGIMRYLIGADAMDGKLAPKKKADADAGVQRGKLPGAKSDVRAKGGMSEAEKREARLEGVRL